MMSGGYLDNRHTLKQMESKLRTPPRRGKSSGPVPGSAQDDPVDGISSWESLYLDQNKGFGPRGLKTSAQTSNLEGFLSALMYGE
jgi:hypothetical protein